MGFGKKYDYPPLLPPGRHVMSLVEVKRLFVDNFQQAERRIHLFYRLEEFIQALLVGRIVCDVWLDGSFLTEKPDPNDIDVTVMMEPDVGANLTDQQSELINKITDGRFVDNVDSFAFVKLSRDDPNFGDEYYDPAFGWGEQYGRESSERYLKGFIILPLRETNVGLRIRS